MRGSKFLIIFVCTTWMLASGQLAPKAWDGWTTSDGISWWQGPNPDRVGGCIGNCGKDCGNVLNPCVPFFPDTGYWTAEYLWGPQFRSHHRLEQRVLRRVSAAVVRRRTEWMLRLLLRVSLRPVRGGAAIHLSRCLQQLLLRPRPCLSSQEEGLRRRVPRVPSRYSASVHWRALSNLVARRSKSSLGEKNGSRHVTGYGYGPC